MTTLRSGGRGRAHDSNAPAGKRPWAWLLGAALAACGAPETTPSSSSSTGPGSSGAGGASSSASTGGGPAINPIMVAPAVPLGWDDRTAITGLAGLTSRCRTVSFGDLDGDGAPDLVLPGTGAVAIFRNDGAGHFALWSTVPVPELGVAQMICATAIADLDGDGRRDLAVGLDRDQPLATGVAVLFNDGAGAFTRVTATQPQSGFPPESAGSTTFGIFSIGVAQTAGQPTVLFLANELDGAAGKADIGKCKYDARGINVECKEAIAGPVSAAFIIPPGTRTVQIAGGAGLVVPGNAQGLGISDFDRDGNDDILVARDYLPQTALRSSGATYTDVSASWSIDTFAHGMGVALGDVDEDGETDAVLSTIGGFVDFKGRGAEGFELRGDASPYSTLRRSVWPWSVLFADLDDNGHLDLLAINEYARHSTAPIAWMTQLGGPADFVGSFNTVIFKDSDTSFREGELAYDTILAGHARAKSVAVADIDGDGHLELAMLVLRAADKENGDLVVGRLAGVTSNHGLTVRLGAGAGQGTRVTLTCAGRTQVREIYGAEGMGAAARTEAHFGCGDATTYEALRIEPRGHAPIDLPGGKLDTAVFVEVP